MVAAWAAALTPFAARLRFWVVWAAGVEITATLVNQAGWHTMLLYNLNWPVEFGLLVAVGALVAPVRQSWLLALAGLFALVYAGNIVQVDPRRELASASVIFGALLLAGLYLYLFWQVACTWHGRLRDAPAFWLSLAVLLYYGGCGPLLGSINYFMRTDMDLASYLHRLTQVLCVAKFVLMAMACYRLPGNLPSVQHEPGY